MTFRILRDEAPGEALRRVVCEQGEKALRELEDDELDVHETVHQVRKRCKKIRGLLRLARPALGETYARENAWFRDVARRLSELRDAQSLLESLDALEQHFEDQVEDRLFEALRLALRARRSRIAADGDGSAALLERCRVELREGVLRIDGWRLDEDGFTTYREGLTRTYARARKAMDEACRAPSAERFHEWRKRVKYHGYHVRFLRSLWRGPLQERRSATEELSDHLGDDHDLSILRATLEEGLGSLELGATDAEALLGLGAQRQAELRARAERLGRRLFAEKPKGFARRFSAYWDAWRSGTDERRALRLRV